MNLVFGSALRRNRPKKNANLIDGGSGFAVVIQTTGRVASWGKNIQGALGDNSITCKITPVNLGGNVKTFCKINAAIGANSNLAIDKYGRAWGWGYNLFGQLGDNTITSRLTPVAVLGAIKTFCEISAGNRHVIAIDKNGRAWGWGYNVFGQLGNNAVISQRTPVSVLGAVKTFCKISAGYYHTAALDKNGRAWAWGANGVGQLGNNAVISQRTPVSVLGAVKTFCQISLGLESSSVIDKNGRAWGWGYNRYGQIGDNSTTNKLTPVSVLGAVKTFCKISSGYSFTAAIDKNGRAWCWGINDIGQLGDGQETITSRLTPVSVAGAVKTFCQISAGQNNTYAIDKNNFAWAWGATADGAIGNNISTFRCSPVSVLGAIKTFCSIPNGLGTIATYAIDKNGQVWAWGPAYLGTVSQVRQFTPVTIGGAAKTFCKMAVRFTHAIAIDKNGRAWGWGNNGNGQIGDNTTTTRTTTPVSIAGAAKTFCQIAGGGRYTLAIDKNGRAWGWGYNGFGQLGDNTLTQRLTPVSVGGAVKTFCKINGPVDDGLSSYALDKNGRAWSWGMNQNNELGDGTVTCRRTPVAVAGTLRTFCHIAAGGNHVLVLDLRGRAWAWGFNGSGQVGDNSVTQRSAPVSVLGQVKTFCQIAGSLSSSFAIDRYGQVWSWGANGNGQLGDGTQTSRRTPVSIVGARKTFCLIAANRNITLAIDRYGRAWTWGWGGIGQLGNGSIDFQKALTPRRVCNI